jgi:hypothetical protein
MNDPKPTHFAGSPRGCKAPKGPDRGFVVVLSGGEYSQGPAMEENSGQILGCLRGRENKKRKGHFFGAKHKESHVFKARAFFMRIRGRCKSRQK